MLNLLNATLNISLLGFTLAMLHTILFTQRVHTEFPRLQKILDSRLARAAAIPGLVVCVVIIPGISVGGVLTLLAHVRQYGWPEFTSLTVVGLWTEASIIGGWSIEYALQRRARNLPAPGFNI